MRNALRDGIYYDLSSEEYHADSAIGSSTLKTLAKKTPAHLRGERKKESATFDFGTALHLAVLEPEKDLIVCGPEDRRGKKWTDLKTACDEAGKILLTDGDYSRVMAARDSIFAHSECVRFFEGEYNTEVSIFGQWQEQRCKIRPDLWHKEHHVFLDLKTCVSASPEAFSRSAADYGYHIQAAFYTAVYNALYWENPVDRFIFLCVEKEPPYAVALYELDEETMKEGLLLALNSLAIYEACQKKQEWPGYSKNIEKISIPSYAFRMVEIPARSGFGANASHKKALIEGEET